MTDCPGELVLHRDQTAWCSEVRAGRACLGNDHPHRAIWTCRLVWGPGDCPRCQDGYVQRSSPQEPPAPQTLAWISVGR